MKLSIKSHKLLRAIYRGIGVTAASFAVFACKEYYDMYGPPPAPEYGPGSPYYTEDLLLRGIVRSKRTGEPIRGIGIWIKDVTFHSAILTDFDGGFYVYVPKMNNYTVVFTDIDGGENGGLFKQNTINLTMEQCEALAKSPLVIEMEN